MELNPIHHPSPAKKNEMPIFGLHSTSDDRPGLVDGLEPHPPPLSSQKNEMLIFGLCSTSDDWPGWSMDSNPIHHPSPVQKNDNAHFWITYNFLWLAQAGRWTRTPSANPLLPKKWNAHFWITFNFWWLAGLVNGLEPHPPPLSSQKTEMLIFGLHSTSDDRPGWSMDSNSIHHPSQAKKKLNTCFWNTFYFWWAAGLVDELEAHLPPLCTQKKWNDCFWITFNFWWSAGLICHPSPAKRKMLISGLRSTSNDQPGSPATPLQPKK